MHNGVLEAQKAKGQMRSVLLLNGNWEVLDVIHWKRALLLLWKNKVRICEEFDDVAIHAFGVNLPSVLALKRLVVIPFGRRFRINKRNLLLRDKHQCQYCGCHLNMGNATIDHITPQSRGGDHIWRNVAAACRACNNRKDNKTLKEAGMHLRHRPYTPSKELVYVGYTYKPEYQHWAQYFTSEGAKRLMREPVSHE